MLGERIFKRQEKKRKKKRQHENIGLTDLVVRDYISNEKVDFEKEQPDEFEETLKQLIAEIGSSNDLGLEPRKVETKLEKETVDAEQVPREVVVDIRNINGESLKAFCDAIATQGTTGQLQEAKSRIGVLTAENEEFRKDNQILRERLVALEERQKILQGKSPKVVRMDDYTESEYMKVQRMLSKG